MGVRLAWESTLAKRMFFEVQRRLPEQTEFVPIASVEAKTYTDTGILAGTNSIGYRVRAVRGTLSSDPSDITLVRFGAVPERDEEAAGGKGSLALAAWPGPRVGEEERRPKKVSRLPSPTPHAAHRRGVLKGESTGFGRGRTCTQVRGCRSAPPGRRGRSAPGVRD